MLSIFIAYLGLYVGVFLGWFSPEELSPGRKYFVFLRKFFFVVLAFFFIYLITDSWYFIIISLVFFFISARWAYFLFPLGYYLYPSDLLASFFYLFCITAGSELVSSFAKDKKIEKRMNQLMLVALKESALFFISFGAYLAFVLF